MTRNRIITLATLAGLLFSGSNQLLAQGRSIPKSEEAKAQEEALPLELPEGQKYRYKAFNGLNISVDILDPIMYTTMFDHCSYEVQVMADLHHRFFPMASFGMGLADETSNNGLDFDTDKKQECNFKSDLAPFAKIGLAYNTKFNDIRPQDYYMVFMRYGFAYSQGDITNLWYASKEWDAVGPIDILDQSYTTHWVELGAMIKVQLWRKISAGWDLYWKVKLHQSGTEQGKPYFMPGFGTTSSSVGFSFRLYYDIF